MVSAIGASTPSSLAGSSRTSGVSRTSGTQALDAQQEAVLRKLQARDKAVRAHEAAHLAVAGGLARGGASYTYELGPDGQEYAIGGEVSIDTSAGRTPDDTLSKAERIRRAALAPADPSAQDFQVAAEAERMEMEARQQLAVSTPRSQSGTDARAANSAYLSAQNPSRQALGSRIAVYA